MINSRHKQWLSPFAATAFFAVSITGVLLLFHMKSGGVYQIHKWGGLLFILAGLLHIMANWRIFASYFKRKTAFSGILAAVAGIALLVVLLPHNDHGGKSRYKNVSAQHGYYGIMQKR